MVSILAPTDAPVVAFGDPVTLTGLATDFDDGDISHRIDWMSSLDNGLGIGSPISVFLSRAPTA